MLPQRGLAYDRDEQAWFHVSSRGLTVVLRPLDPEASAVRFELPGDEERIRDFVEKANVYPVGRIAVEVAGLIDFPPEGYRHDERDRWRAVAEILSDGSASAEAPADTAMLIPVTRLRRFYEMLRLLNASSVHAATATHLCGREGIERLDALFASSLVHLRRYRNADQPFHERISGDWFETYADRPRQFARALVARLRPGGEPASLHVPGDPPATYHVVDYEVSPLRTAGGFQFEDGRSGRSSGAGGMDLLLSTLDGVPVIGEIKSRGDTSLFLALVQALMYASEILTDPQMERLRGAYPRWFSQYTGAPVCEILILHEESDEPRLSQEATQMATRLMGDQEGCVARHIRRITIASVLLDSRPDPSLSTRFKTTSVRHPPR